MKNIKFLSFIVIALCFLQTAYSQAASDQNGRSADAKPAAIQPSVEKENYEINKNDDADVPGSYTNGNVLDTPPAEWTFPTDLDALADEVGSVEMDKRVDQLEDQIRQLVSFNEQLRLENRAIKKSLNSCCAAGGLEVAGDAAYLLQNAPNPFQQSTAINYFVPETSQNARLEIRGVKGELIKEMMIKNNGLGRIDLESQSLEPGTYVYSLYIGTDIIDSKVMLITK